MSRTLCAVLAVLIVAGPASGSTYTTVLVGDGSDRVTFDFDAPAGPPNTWPDATPDSANWIFGALPGDGPFDLTVRYNESLVGVVPPTAGTYVFELIVTDNSGLEVHDLMGEEVTLGFVYDAGTPTNPGCLGYYDETTQMWVCEDRLSEDKCLAKENGRVCGNTSHFSLFSLGPVPEPGTHLLLCVGLVGLAARGRFRARSGRRGDRPRRA